MNLVGPFSKVEVRATIKYFNGEGSPGPDGLPVFFYKDPWDLVRLDVIAIFEEFRQVNCGIERINNLHLFLHPKCRANRVEDFQPISLYYHCKSNGE